MRTRRVRPPRHFNPSPKFGLRRLTCIDCGIELEREDNPIYDLGGGVLVKFGLCGFCGTEEMREREYWGEAEAVRRGWLTYV